MMNLTTISNEFSTTVHSYSTLDYLINTTILISSIIMSTGVIQNVIIFYAIYSLIKEGKLGNASAITLLIQSGIDVFACIFSIEENYDKLSWEPANPFWLAAAICYTLHSQFIFNGLILFSLFHTVLLAFERYFSVLMPFKAKMLWSRFYRVTVTCIVTIISTLTIYVNYNQAIGLSLIGTMQLTIGNALQMIFFALNPLGSFLFLPGIRRKILTKMVPKSILSNSTQNTN